MSTKKAISFIPEVFEEKELWQLRIVKDRCKGCLFCIKFCPMEILESSSEFNARGYHPPKLKKGLTMDDCAKCGFCELICPEFSIFLEKVKVEPEEEEIRKK